MKKLLAVTILLCGAAWGQTVYPVGWTNTGLSMPTCQYNSDTSIHGTVGCAAIFAYSGALWDSKRGRMVQWGGGHGDYGGNELAVITDKTYTWLTAPTRSGIFSCTNNVGNGSFDIESLPPTNPTGTCTDAGASAPNSRHTYMGLTYMPSVDKYFLYGHALASAVGYRTSRFWTFDPNTSTFAESARSFQALAYTGSLIADWDNQDGVVYVANSTYLNKYNPNTDTLTQIGGASAGYGLAIGGLDTINRRMVVFDAEGAGYIIHWPLDGTAPSNVTSSATNCSAMLAALVAAGSGTQPGVAYDPRHGDFVLWPTGSGTVYFYNSATKACTSQTYSGQPSAATGGVYGRIRYAPQICPECFLVVNSPTQVYVWRRDTTGGENIGQGATTATCIDKDADGYGTGSGCLGPDADDNDPGVNTAASMLARWGTVTAFLQHSTAQHAGYAANAKIYYIAPTPTGSDSNNCTSAPCATYAHVATLVAGDPSGGQDDVVLWRAGSYSDGIENVSGPNGTAGHPIILMAYPGEQVTFTGTRSGIIDLLRTGDPATSTHDIVIDGFTIAGTSNAHGIEGGSWTNVTIRNVHASAAASGSSMGLELMQDSHYVTIEDSSFHDTGSHGVYLGARDYANDHITFQRNLVYNTNSVGLQHNGRCTTCNFDGNIVYGNYGAGIALMRGVKDSFVRNNLTFNNQEEFKLFNYDSVGATCPPYCNYDETGNLIENNTFWNSGLQRDGSSSSYAAVHVLNTSSGLVGDLGNNTFRNNLFVTASAAGHISPVTYNDATYGSNYLSTTTFDHNVFYVPGQNWTISKAEPYGGGGYIGYSCTGAAALTTLSVCINADPSFVASNTAWYATPASFNFDLATGSPAIDNGSSTGAPITDIRGRSRGTIDIGAYEANGTTSTSTYTLTCNASPTLGGSCIGGGSYASGYTVTPTYTANSGYTFTGWSGACTGTGACSVVMVSNATVTANFTADTGPTVTGVSVSTLTPTIVVGNYADFTCTATMTTGPDVDCTSLAVWDVSVNPTVANITGGVPGRATGGPSTGTATIRATYGGQSGTATLTVNPAPTAVPTTLTGTITVSGSAQIK